MTKAVLCNYCGRDHIEVGHAYIMPIPKGYHKARVSDWFAPEEEKMHVNHLSSSDFLRVHRKFRLYVNE